MGSQAAIFCQNFFGKKQLNVARNYSHRIHGINIVTHMTGCFFFYGFHVSTYTIHGSYGILLLTQGLKSGVTLEGRTYHEEFLIKNYT